MYRRVPFARLFGFGVLLLAACDGEQPAARPSHGARIAEPDSGRWVWICSVHVSGPKRDALQAAGKGSASTRELARTSAIRDGCKKVNGGRACQTAMSGWQLGAAHCADAAKKKPTVVECSIEVKRPAGKPRASQQAEAPSAERACRRARREACRQVSGGSECNQGLQGWQSQKSVARRR